PLQHGLMASKILRFRRLKWGDPERKLPVLVEDLGKAADRGHKQTSQKLSVPTVLAGLLVASAFGVGYTINSGASESLKALLPSAACNIKGNISISTGERIYHVPGQTYYEA